MERWKYVATMEAGTSPLSPALPSTTRVTSIAHADPQPLRGCYNATQHATVLLTSGCDVGSEAVFYM